MLSLSQVSSQRRCCFFLWAQLLTLSEGWHVRDVNDMATCPYCREIVKNDDVTKTMAWGIPERWPENNSAWFALYNHRRRVLIKYPAYYLQHILRSLGWGRGSRNQITLNRIWIGLMSGTRNQNMLGRAWCLGPGVSLCSAQVRPQGMCS